MTLRSRFARFAAAILLVGLAAPAPAARAGDTPDLQGVASVIDGDTIEIHGQRVRLFGIDAPEAGQACLVTATNKFAACGRASAFALDDLIGGQSVQCYQRGAKSYDRIVAECFAGGRSVNAIQVRAGQAIAATYFSQQFVGDQRAAQQAQLGLWRTQFVDPYKWRKGERLPGEPNVKGQYGVKR